MLLESISLLHHRPLFYFFAPASAVEMMLTRLLVLLNFQEIVSPVLVAVFKRKSAVASVAMARSSEKRVYRVLVYYILLIAERFHDWGHLSGGVVDLGFVPITPVKVVGALAVITALILPRQPDAADRRANPVVFLFSIFACYPLLMTWTLGRALPASALASLISLWLLFLATRALVSTEASLRNSIRVLVLVSAFSTLWCFKQMLGGAGRAWGVGLDPEFTKE